MWKSAKTGVTTNSPATVQKQSIGEMKHAEVLIESILFLDGTPSMEPLKLTVGGNVQHRIASRLELELGAVKQHNMREEKVITISLWATKADAERYERDIEPKL